MGLYETLRRARDIQTEDGTIKFFQLLYDSQDIGKDDAGICEWVIEAAVIFEKREKANNYENESAEVCRKWKNKRIPGP